MSVGGRIIEISDATLENGQQVKCFWVIDRDGFEQGVFAEPAAILPKLRDEIWWQSGKIMFDGDRRTLKKVGYSWAK